MSSKQVDWTVYGLVDPRNGEIFYVGCTSMPDERLRGHIRDARNKPRKNPRKATRINAIVKNGHQPVMVTLEITNETEHDQCEKEWIIRLAKSGSPITNCLIGNIRRYIIDEITPLKN